MTATTAIAQVEAKREMHGRVLALQTVLIGGPLAIGGPILGWVADTFGGRAPMILGGSRGVRRGGDRYVGESPLHHVANDVTNHSARIAVIGSTASARFVGTMQASSAAPIRTTPPTMNETGSSRSIP